MSDMHMLQQEVIGQTRICGGSGPSLAANSLNTQVIDAPPLNRIIIAFGCTRWLLSALQLQPEQ